MTEDYMKCDLQYWAEFQRWRDEKEGVGSRDQGESDAKVRILIPLV